VTATGAKTAGWQPTKGTAAVAAAAAAMVGWSLALATPSGGLETNYRRAPSGRLLVAGRHIVIKRNKMTLMVGWLVGGFAWLQHAAPCRLAVAKIPRKNPPLLRLLAGTGWPQKSVPLVSGVAGLSASSSSKADTLNI